jgi:siderophore synthetase component
LINDCLEYRINDSKAIAIELKQNPFAIMNALKQKDAIQNHTVFLQGFFKKLIELDHAIKTGEVPDSYFWLAVKEQILKYHS